MTIKKLDSHNLLIDRDDDIEGILRKGHEEDLTGAVLIYEDATHCEIAEWLCENPIDAKGIIEEMEKLLKQPQKQLISFDKIPKDNIFETAVVSDTDYSAELTEILNIEGVEARKEKLINFVYETQNIQISILQSINQALQFSAGDPGDPGEAYKYTFAYPFSQFIKD